MTTTFEILAPVWWITLAAICKAVCDTLAHHFNKSIFSDKRVVSWGAYQWWDPKLSWAFKWEPGTNSEKERFLGSSTIFVWFTDAWHLFNAIQYTAIILAIVWYFPVYYWWVDAIILKAVFTITFEVFYRWVFVKKA